MKKKWWLIGGLIVASAGVGAYFLFRPSKEERAKKKLAKRQDKVEGNAFRKWINETYPDYAKTIKLDPEGAFNNAYIKKAYQKYGTEYTKKQSGVVSLEMTSTFQKAMEKWNKPASITTTTAIPYFKIKFRPLYEQNNCHKKYVSSWEQDSGGMKGKCDGELFIFNNLIDTKPKDGKVAWTIYWGDGKVAQGYGSFDLTNIETTYNKVSSRATMGFIGKSTVGNSFGQIIGWDGSNCNMRLAWC